MPLFIIISLHSILLIGSATMLIEIARGDTRNLIIRRGALAGDRDQPDHRRPAVGPRRQYGGVHDTGAVAKMADMLAPPALRGIFDGRLAGRLSPWRRHRAGRVVVG